MALLTIDILASSVYGTLLHPLLATLPATTILARGESITSPTFRWAVIYALFVILLRFAFYVDARIAGGSSRPLRWQDEVVVITGGAGGLGGLMAEMYALRGVPTAVLDVVPEDQGRRKMEALGVAYYECDVAREEAVGEVREMIEKDLGTPTILINTAAIVAGGPVLKAPLERALSVNVLGAAHTISAFLPAMLTRPGGGTIVNVSSVLGELGCAGLGAYAASKAALTALHFSLRAELGILARDAKKYPGARNVRMVLSRPGQLGTNMFLDVKPPSEFLGPTVAPANLARLIVEAVDGGRHAEVDVPLYARWIGWMAVLPAGLTRCVRWMAGLDGAGWKAYGKMQVK